VQTSAQAKLFSDPEPEYVIGIDESGTGAWAGPFHVAGVLAATDWKLDGVGDSKAIADAKRRELVPLIEAGAMASHVVEVDVRGIDSLGQRPEWRRAIQEILDELEPQIPEGAVYRVIIDGGRDRRLARQLGMDQRTRPLGVDFVPKADKHHQHVGAASILAKTARNDVMLGLHEKDPRFGWNENYGYITQAHVEAVTEHGKTTAHRNIETKLRRKVERMKQDSGLASGAVIEGAFRYKLWRRWKKGGHVTFVMLNPSTADGVTDDPTIRKCVGFAKRWGYAGIEVVNLYALRSTDPDALLSHITHPQYQVDDTRNDAAIITSTTSAGVVVCAWGGHKAAQKHGRIARVLHLLDRAAINPMCLGLTKLTSQPRHPLMLAYKTKLELLKMEGADGERDE
jgi:ribonuclease HII